MRRYLDHTADLRAEIEAPDFETLLGESLALVREILVGASPVEPRFEREVGLAEREPGERLFRFVRELVYLADSEAFLPAGLRVEGAVASVSGETFDPARHVAERQVKAVTRHQFHCERAGQGWRAGLVFDL
jgi:SHS2 domain-containing protein